MCVQLFLGMKNVRRIPLSAACNVQHSPILNIYYLFQRTQASSKFRFMTKRGSEDERVFGQQCLDVVGEMIRGVMPSTYAVNKVLNARVPIVKFRHEATELDCDLSYFNM